MPVPNSSHRSSILSLYRELLRLISRQPLERAAAAREEARSTVRARSAEANPEQLHLYHKELASRVSFLRITTPRTPGEPVQGGRFVLRDGQLVEGSAADKGSRAADGSISMAEAQRMNADHYKRFYGKPKPKTMLF